MNRESLIDLLFEKGKENKIDHMEVYIIKDSSLDLNVYENELEKYVVSEEESLSLRGIYKNKMGYSYTENLVPESLDELINNLIQYAENNDNENDIEGESILSTKEENNKFVPKINLLNQHTEEEKIEYLLDLEKRAYAVDKRIKSISYCSYSENTQNIYIKNTKGLELEDSHSIGTIGISVVTEEDEDIQTGNAHHVFSSLKEAYKDLLIKNGVGDAIAMLGAKSIASGNYEVILRNNVAADIFSNFSSVFLGNIVQKDLSLMKDKLNTEVAVDFFSIKENPLMESGKYCRRFDDEGTPTYSKYLIENGVLKTFLHNKTTSEKEGLPSTGNGFKTSHKASIGVMSTNAYVVEGSESLNEMISSMDMGVVITDIHGLHAGINPTSGDFSLSANGLLVEKGAVVRPLGQITVAGNLYTMLKNIKSIGNDTSFSHPSSSYFGSPSIYIKSLTVSGK